MILIPRDTASSSLSNIYVFKMYRYVKKSKLQNTIYSIMVCMLYNKL